jgi:hypothetical protein
VSEIVECNIAHPLRQGKYPKLCAHERQQFEVILEIVFGAFKLFSIFGKL